MIIINPSTSKYIHTYKIINSIMVRRRRSPRRRDDDGRMSPQLGRIHRCIFRMSGGRLLIIQHADAFSPAGRWRGRPTDGGLRPRAGERDGGVDGGGGSRARSGIDEYGGRRREGGMVGAGTLLLGGQRPGSPACLNLACNAPHHAEPRVTTGTPNWLFKLQLVAGTGSNGRDREPVAGEAILASFFSSEKRLARRKFHYCLVALGYLQPFPPSNSPQTYYLLYFTTSLQKIPPYNSFSPTIPSYLFPLYTITH